jgi:ABC-2 type transport system permease protein
MLRAFLLAAGAVWRRELLHFWRERSRVAGFVGSPLIFWLIIGSGFGDLARFFSGALLLSVMFTAVFATMSVIEDRREGFLLAMLASPAPRCAVVTGKVLGGAAMAAAQGLLFLACLPLAGAPLSLAALPGAAAGLALTGFSFTAMGFWLAWRSRTPQGFHALMNIVLMPLWMISGALFTMETAHPWLRAAMAGNPLLYFHAVLERTLMPGAAGAGPGLGVSFAVTAAAGIVFLTAAIYAVERRPMGGSQ